MPGASSALLLTTLAVGLTACQAPTEDAAARAAALATVEVRSQLVSAADETGSVAGDADDPAIWVHPTDPSRSVIIGTDKDNGLATWDLAGKPLQFIPNGEPNNVDLRYGFPLGGRSVDLVAANNRDTSALEFFAMDHDSRQLVPLPGPGIPSQLSETYGICMYHSPVSDRFYVFVNDKDGDVEQWLIEDRDGAVLGSRVRVLDVEARTEGCVADDAQGALFISAERRAIWKFGAEPDDLSEPVLIDVSKLKDLARGHLIPEVEGLAIYEGPGDEGYLIASSQGSDDFVLYDRRPPHNFLGRFGVSADAGRDPVTHSDGIEVTSAELPGYPGGLFVAHDAFDEDPYNNFKLVAWESIAEVMDLPIRSAFDRGLGPVQ